MTEEKKQWGAVPNAPKLTGRLPGAISKQTRMRNEMMREKILATNIIFRAVDEISERLATNPESVRMSELINIITKVAPYVYQTVSEEQIEETIASIASREDAEKQIAQLNEAVGYLRAVK